MKKTKLASTLLIGSLVAGSAVSMTCAVTNTVAKADDTQSQNQSDTTEIQTNSQTITRTIKYDLSDVQQYLKPGVEYPKDQTQSVTIMQQGVKGSDGHVDYGDWSVGTFSSISLTKLQGINSNIKLIPVNESGAEVSEVPQQSVKHGDQNTTITIKYKAVDTSKNDANQNNTAADQNSTATNPDPEPEQPKGQTPEISDSSLDSTDQSSVSDKQSSKANDTKGDDGNSGSNPSADKTDSSSQAESDSKNSNSSSTNAMNSSSQASSKLATDNSGNKATDTQLSSNSDQKSDDQTNNGLPVQNNGTSQTTSKTEAQPNTGNLPQTGDTTNHKGIAAALSSLLMLVSACLVKLKSLF